MKVNRDMINLAEELLRMGKEDIRIPIKTLSRFSKKIEKMEKEEIHPGQIIIPLIRGLESGVRHNKRMDGIDKGYKLLLIKNKEDIYYNLLSNIVFAEKGKMR